MNGMTRVEYDDDHATWECNRCGHRSVLDRRGMRIWGAMAPTCDWCQHVEGSLPRGVMEWLDDVIAKAISKREAV